MSITQFKWSLRLGLPLAGLAIALLCGRTIGGAIGMVFFTAFLMVVVVATPLLFVGIIFVPILALYGLKMSSRDEPEMDLRDPDIQFFLCVGIPGALATVGLLSLYGPS